MYRPSKGYQVRFKVPNTNSPPTLAIIDLQDINGQVTTQADYMLQTHFNLREEVALYLSL